MSRSYILALSFVGIALCASSRLWLADLRARRPLPEEVLLRLGSAELRQGEYVEGVVTFSSGKKLATCSEHNLLLWDLTTGALDAACPLPVQAERPTLQAGAGPAGGRLAAAADGSAFIALIGQEAFLCRQPFSKNPPVALPPRPAASGVVAVVPLPKGDAVVGFTRQGKMMEWRPGEVKWSSVESPFDAAEDVKDFTCTINGGVVAVLSGRKKGRVVIWAASQGRRVSTHEVGTASALAVSADGGRLLTVGERAPAVGSFIEVRGVADDKVLSSWKTDHRVAAAVLSENGKLAAVSYSVAEVQARTKVDVFDAATGKVLQTLPVGGIAWRLTFLPDGALVTTDLDGVIQIWDATAGTRRLPKAPAGHQGHVMRVSAGPGGGWLSAGSDGAVIVWGADGKEVRRLEGHAGAVLGLVLSNDGKTLYTSGSDGTVREWDAGSGKERRTCFVDPPLTKYRPRTKPPVLSLALSPNGQRLAAGVDAGEVRILETTGLTVESALRPKEKGDSGTLDVTFVSNDLLVSRCAQRQLYVWDLETKGGYRRIDIDGADAMSARVAAVPNRKTVASPTAPAGLDPLLAPHSAPCDVGFWDAGRGKLLERVKTGGETAITAVTYLPDGKTIAVGDAAGAVRVIDLATKTVRHTFAGHRGPVLCLAAAPDGKSLASGGADTTVLVWKLDPP